MNTLTSNGRGSFIGSASKNNSHYPNDDLNCNHQYIYFEICYYSTLTPLNEKSSTPKYTTNVTEAKQASPASCWKAFSSSHQ